MQAARGSGASQDEPGGVPEGTEQMWQRSGVRWSGPGWLLPQAIYLDLGWGLGWSLAVGTAEGCCVSGQGSCQGQ